MHSKEVYYYFQTLSRQQNNWSIVGICSFISNNMEVDGWHTMWDGAAPWQQRYSCWTSALTAPSWCSTMSTQIKTLCIPTPMLGYCSIKQLNSYYAREAGVLISPHLLCTLVIRDQTCCSSRTFLESSTNGLGQALRVGMSFTAGREGLQQYLELSSTYIGAWSLIDERMNKWTYEWIHSINSHWYWILWTMTQGQQIDLSLPPNQVCMLMAFYETCSFLSVAQHLFLVLLQIGTFFIYL